MKILWVCNVALPEIAAELNMEASNKEGWLSGIAHAVLKNQDAENPVEIAIAFPVGSAYCDPETQTCHVTVTIENSPVECYGFVEDVVHPECYDCGLEERLDYIIKCVQPDIVHCFGTEYPHTLAACKAFPRKDRILLGIQGLCAIYAKAYYANLPESVVKSVTFRDLLKKDSILQQQHKFFLRGENEIAAIRLAGNVTGRTKWDKESCYEWNPNAKYFKMNENLRKDFYENQWSLEECVPHSIFLSQGDYPIKGLHYMLLALPDILAKYPDTKVYVAGNSLVNYKTLKDKIKISAYGRYLRKLLKENGIEDKVVFLGRMKADEMLKQYLKSHLFVCSSSIENSSNSLGEAMLLGMPCVSADVGGLSSIFEPGVDGIMYDAYKVDKNNSCDYIKTDAFELENISKRLSNAVLQMWDDETKMLEYCVNARNHARKTHDYETNCRKMTEIYAEIMGEQEEG